MAKTGMFTRKKSKDKQMKKFLLIGTALIALSAATPAHADSTTETTTTTSSSYDSYSRAHPSDSPLSGLYVGIYGGYDWSDADITGANPDIDGFDGGVFLGYRIDHLWDSAGMTAAIEVAYGNSGADDTSGGITFEKGSEWEVSFRPGFEAVNQMTSGIGLVPYGIIGYRNTKFSATGVGGNGSHRYDGFELGIGTEVMAMGNFGVRAEYAHTWYGEEAGLDPDSNDLRLGVAYHF